MAKAPVKKDSAEQVMPSAEEQAQLLESARAFALNARFARTCAAMSVLSASPPQSLLLEGGSRQERGLAALYWAALLNCGQAHAADKARKPCFECPACLHFFSRMHRDLFFFDGSAGSIKVEEVREMRAVLAEPPREAAQRVIVLFESQALGEAAANTLLKSLEEPKPGNSFVLTAPQRERLLPTLVSRSWVLTLPWPRADEFSQISDAELAAVSEWGRALLDFARTGRGWMERTARRASADSPSGAMDAKMAMQLVLLCQNALARALGGGLEQATPLAQAFARLSPQNRRILDETLAECQDSLIFNVNAALVADWLATRVYFLFAKQQGM